MHGFKVNEETYSKLKEMFDAHENCEYPKGSRVEKINSEESDNNPDGTQGTITGGINMGMMTMYRVVFDTIPLVETHIIAPKLKLISNENTTTT